MQDWNLNRGSIQFQNLQTELELELMELFQRKNIIPPGRRLLPYVAKLLHVSNSNIVLCGPDVSKEGSLFRRRRTKVAFNTKLMSIVFTSEHYNKPLQMSKSDFVLSHLSNCP